MKEIQRTLRLLLCDQPSGKDSIAKEWCSASPATLDAAHFQNFMLSGSTSWSYL
jgi:hypothetical protein